MVFVDVQEDAGTAKAFAQQNGFTFPVALDSDGAVARAFRVNGIPTTFILDAQGRIVESVVGAVDEQRLIQALDQASAR